MKNACIITPLSKRKKALVIGFIILIISVYTLTFTLFRKIHLRGGFRHMKYKLWIVLLITFIIFRVLVFVLRKNLLLSLSNGVLYIVEGGIFSVLIILSIIVYNRIK